MNRLSSLILALALISLLAQASFAQTGSLVRSDALTAFSQTGDTLAKNKTGTMPDYPPAPGPDDTDDSSGGSDDGPDSTDDGGGCGGSGGGSDDSGPDSTGGTDF